MLFHRRVYPTRRIYHRYRTYTAAVVKIAVTQRRAGIDIFAVLTVFAIAVDLMWGAFANGYSPKGERTFLGLQMKAACQSRIEAIGLLAASA